MRDSDLPVAFEDDIALNALVLKHTEQFAVPANTDEPQPSPDTSPPTGANGHDERSSTDSIHGRGSY